ncbi:MAG: GNAT family N-acetyltransferase [Chloroflexi bacterium]|nr:GNAT family N-acetyltransferase [Chloroflexota bacterium]
MYRIRPWLYIGKYRETIDHELLRAHHIGAMLLLAENVEQPGIEALYLPVEDGEPLPDDALQRGVAFIRAQKAAGRAVLAACGAGISRSVTFATAALVEEEGLSLVDAYRAIQVNHPYAMPHPALWESLRAHYRADVSFGEMWDHMKKVRGLGIETNAAFPALETERLLLRQLEMADAPAIQELAGHPAIAATTLSIPHPYPDGAAEAWIRGTHESFERGEDYVFAIIRKSSGVFLGTIRLGIQTEHQRGELGYWIGKPYWGQGYATEAVSRVIRFGFLERQLNRIHASYFTTNPASARVMQKAGMKYEGILRQHIRKNGELIDLGLYGLLRSEYTEG